ncbi:MAG: DUF4387 domain-containing protein [Alphaproteobacteria bacterium]|nr:MAG: DUF4387 domain-containing protein [Alphaproteobacteria bacterium]
MTRLSDATRHIRTKQAGPFWVTMDIWFKDEDSYTRYHDCPALSAETFARVYGTNADFVKRIPMPEFNLVKISYPRATPQGGMIERDMHSGQQYARLLDIELD